ncbi:MAG: hypothetical protein HY815_14440 [Candidatus Riflebacteria bacterium]|nr:hypothetical protein [Candidatus Riflebacteria bacterium]
MSTSEFKVAVLGCGGIGRLVSTIVRQAVHLIAVDRPGQVVVVSSGSLTGDVPEALAAARGHPLLVIDGCRPRCGSKICQGKGITPAATIYVADVVARGKLSLAGEKREELGAKGMAAARIDWLVADELVSTL